MIRDEPASGSRPLCLYIAVAMIAAVVHTVSILATQLWVYPDSIDYIELAGGIVTRGDWSNELFLIRPPGYPLLLALVFKLFGPASPIAIQVFQHALAIGTAVLTAAIAWRTTHRRIVTLVAGVLCGCSLQMLSYSNLALTEIPFTAAFIASAYFLICYVQIPRARSLAASGALAGAAYMIKPIGVVLFAGIAVIVCLREWQEARSRAFGGSAAKQWIIGVVRNGIVAALPVLLFAAPWLIHSASAHHSSATNRCLDYVLYVRPIEFDRLDTPATKSAALQDILSVVAEARERGLVASDADHRDRLTVIQAYERVRGLSFTETTEVLGRAGLDVILENPTQFAVNTVKYAAWLVLAPDPVYRFVPGGAPGVGGQRDKSADFYDIATYSKGPGSWEQTLEKHEAYLPITVDKRPMTNAWNRLKRSFHSEIATGPSPIGLRDSLYEELILFCCLSGVCVTLRRRSLESFTLLLIVVTYVGVSALLAGPQTRYAIVIKPILFVWGAIGVVASARLFVAAFHMVTSRETPARTARLAP